MDLKKLLNESESFKQAIADQHKADDINRYLGITQPEDLEKIMKTAGSGIFENPAITSEREARQAIERALGLSGLGPESFQTAAEMMRKEIERNAGIGTLASNDPLALSEQLRADIEKASGMPNRKQASDIQGLSDLNFEKFERQAKERQEEMMMEMTRDHSQLMVRQATEFRRREDAKVEYARRSAEASEAALEAEKARTADAKADALLAREEARIARRNMRISLWIAAGSLLVAAWPFIKEANGW